MDASEIEKKDDVDLEKHDCNKKNYCVEAEVCEKKAEKTQQEINNDLISQAKVYKNYINGWDKVNEGHNDDFGLLIDRNPATGEILGLFPNSGPTQVSMAVFNARKSFHSWRKVSRIKRAEYLDKLAQIIDVKKQELAELVTIDCGKPINEGMADVIETIHMIQCVVGEAGMPCGTVLSSEIAEKTVYMIRKPIGVMAAITPWNFPLAIPMWLIAPSLVEGNTVVWKPSEETPLVANRLMELCEEVGFPKGVLNMVQGGKETGKTLATDRDIDRVLFTGSSSAAEWITQEQAKLYPHRLPPVCEKGGKNALIVLEDAKMNIAVDAAILSAFRTSGQRCVSAGRIIVHKNLIDEFSEKFVEKAKNIRAGNPLSPNIFMGPLINRAGFEKVQRFNYAVIKLAKEWVNFEILFEGGYRIDNNLYGEGEVFYIDPFIYRIKNYWAARSAFVLKEEAFGPHVAIIPCVHMEDAINIYNDTDFGLSCGVITENYRKFDYCVKNCDAGLFYHNLPTIGAESRIKLSFGGVKRSGTGLPSAGYLIEAVTHKIAVTINNDEEIKLAQGLSAKV